MKNLSLLATLITVVLFSCTKENSDEFIPNPGNPYNDTTWSESVTPDASINKLFELLSPPSETDSFDLATGSTLHFANGLQISVPAHGCVEADEGLADIAVDFLKSKGDFIRHAKPSTSNGDLLVSGGAIQLTVIQNGTILHLSDDKTISISYPTAEPDPSMTVFYGDVSLNDREGFNWIEANDNISKVEIAHTDTADLYEIVSRKFEWINCDHYLNYSGDLTRISVILPPNFTNNNTAAFLVSTNDFIVARFNADVPNRTFYVNNIPVGEPFMIITISKIGDDLYLGTHDVTISNGLTVELSPEKNTQEEIGGFLDSL